MPIYEFKCPACETILEKTKKFSESDEIELCPICLTEMVKVISAPPVHFKGTGWCPKRPKH